MEHKNFLNSYQKNALSPKDKTKYETIVAATGLGAILTGMAVVYFVKKQGGSTSKQIGFGLGATALAYGIAYLATIPYSNKLATKTGVSSNSTTAMEQESKAELQRLRDEALRDIYAGGGIRYDYQLRQPKKSVMPYNNNYNYGYNYGYGSSYGMV